MPGWEAKDYMMDNIIPSLCVMLFLISKGELDSLSLGLTDWLNR